jgi:hypothetical protein
MDIHDKVWRFFQDLEIRKRLFHLGGEDGDLLYGIGDGIFTPYELVVTGGVSLTRDDNTKTLTLEYDASTVGAGPLPNGVYGDGTNTSVVTIVNGHITDVSETPIVFPPGGGIDGTGTADFIPKWSDADTLTDSQMKDAGTVQGIRILHRRLGIGGAADDNLGYVNPSGAYLYVNPDVDGGQASKEFLAVFRRKDNTVNNADSINGYGFAVGDGNAYAGGQGRFIAIAYDDTKIPVFSFLRNSGTLTTRIDSELAINRGKNVVSESSVGGTVSLLQWGLDNVFRLGVRVGTDQAYPFIFLIDHVSGYWEWYTHSDNTSAMKLDGNGDLTLKSKVKFNGSFGTDGDYPRSQGAGGAVIWENPEDRFYTESEVDALIAGVGGGSADGTMLFGTGVPAGGTGINGDSYTDTNNGKVYKKATGAWTEQIDLVKESELTTGLSGKSDTGHTHATLPTADEKASLVGMTTAPSAANPVATEDDILDTLAYVDSEIASIAAPTVWREHAIQKNGGLTTLTLIGWAPAGIGTITSTDDDDGLWGRFASSTTLSNSVGILTSTGGGFNLVKRGWGPELYFRIKTDASVANIRLWLALATAQLTTATPTGQHIGIRYDTTAGDTNWMCSTDDNATQNTVSSGVAVAAATVYEFFIDMKDTANIKFYINNVLVQTLSSNLPATTLFMGLNFMTTTTLAGTATAFKLDHLRLRWPI